MALEQLAPFSSLYAEKAKLSLDKAIKRLEKRQSQVETFKTLRASLVKEAETMGFIEDFNRLFPEDGDGPFFTQSDLNTYIGMLDLVDDSKQLKAFYKISTAPYRLVTAQEYLKRAEADVARDPEEYLSELYGALVKELAKTSSLGGGNMESLMKKVFEDQEEYEDIIEFTPDHVEGPGGLKTSPEAYAYLKAKSEQEPIPFSSENKEQESASPINNEIEQKEQDQGQSAEDSMLDPINPDETEKEVDSADPNFISSEKIDIPDEEIVETEAINIEDSTDQNEEVSPINQEEQVVENETLPEEVDQKMEVVNSSENISNINQEGDSIENKSTINQGGDSIENISNIDTIDAPTIDQGLNTSNEIYNFLNKTSADGPLSNINESTLNNNISNVTESASSMINQGSSFSQQGGDMLSMLSSITGMDYGNVNNISNVKGAMDNVSGLSESINEGISEVSSEFSSIGDNSIVPPSPVTKSDIAKVGENISNSVSNATTLNSPSSSSENVMNNNTTEISNINSSPNSNQSGDSSGAESVVTSQRMDTAMIEKRLRSIEILLQGPLEVKIKR